MWAFLMSGFTQAAGAAHDRSDTVPAWLQPPSFPDPSEYRLQPLGDGYRYGELTFSAPMAPSGVVTFHDRLGFFDRLLFLHRHMLGAMRAQVLGILASSRPGSGLPFLAVPEQGPLPGSPAAPINGSVLCPEPSTCHALPGLLVLSGVNVSADLTDEILRDLGQDLYCMQKARFLAATQDVRMKLAVQAQQDDSRTSLEHLPERLAGLWHNGHGSAPERRRLLCELWRETDDSDAGPRARDTSLTFIRRILPCKNPEAHSATESRALQAIDTGPTFSPCGAGGR